MPHRDWSHAMMRECAAARGLHLGVLLILVTALITACTSEAVGGVLPGEEAGGTLPVSAAASPGWQVFANDTAGYAFEYPEGSEFNQGGSWTEATAPPGTPVFSIFAVSDLGDPIPLGQDPLDYVIVRLFPDPNVGSLIHLPDIEIAGRPAAHARIEPDPGAQIRPSDIYVFSENGLFYVVTIEHRTGEDDSALSAHFLNSIRLTR